MTSDPISDSRNNFTLDADELTSFTNKLADKSGGVIKKYYRQLDKIETKGDSSPVTIADKEVELALRDMIKEQYPNHEIEGEEFGLENENKSDYRWVIDPIDGTLAFIAGRPTFGTLISLLYKKKSILGVIDQPINNERWVGLSGSGATFNKFNGTNNNNESKSKSAISTSNCEDLKDAIICTTGPNYFTEEKLKIFNKISVCAKYTIYGGDCYNYGLLALGQVDAVIESGLKPHDFFAFIPIIKEAGGVVTDWQGSELSHDSCGDIVVSCNEKIHAQILQNTK